MTIPGLLATLPRSLCSLGVVLALGACDTAPPEAAGDPRTQGPLFQLQNFRQTAPDSFQATFETSQGDFVVVIHREWAPLAADRFFNLVVNGWYDGVRFHRVLNEFTAGFGIHDDPYVNVVWRKRALTDDPVLQRNSRGRLSFAKSTPNSRTVQVFVNLKDNSRSLDDNGFAPFGEVIEGMEVIDALYSGYGDGPPRGDGVYQAMAIAKGSEYLDEFPELDRINRATVLPEGS